MTQRVYLNDIVPWWPIERQEAALSDVMATAVVFQDLLSRRQRQGHSAADLVQRAQMLRPTNHVPRGEVIHVATLAILARTQIELLDFLSALVSRGSALVTAETSTTYRPLTEALFPQIIEDWKQARVKSRIEGATLRGGEATKVKYTAIYKARFARIKDHWGDPEWPTKTLLAEACDENGKSMARNTANKYAGMTREQAIAREEVRLKRKKAKEPKTDG